MLLLLSAQILVHHNLDTSVHVKSHITIVKCTVFISIIYLNFQLTFLLNFTMLCTQTFVQSFNWTHFQFTFLLNLMLLLLSTQILVQSYTWTHFQFTFLLNLMLLLLSTQILVQSYTWTHFVQLFVKSDVTTFLYKISYKYYC